MLWGMEFQWDDACATALCDSIGFEMKANHLSFDYSSEGDAHPVTTSGDLHPGTRVMIRGNLASATLRSRTGYIVGPDTVWEDFFIIRLDHPALYHHANGETEELAEIREGFDNLIILPE